MVRPLLTLLLTDLVRRLRVSQKVGALEVELAPKPSIVLWRRRLSWLVAMARHLDRRIIVVLDEMDRCAPVAAQNALTLARRCLSIDGLVVIVPYVEPQIHRKVFDPFATDVIPDLRTTMEAVLWAQLDVSSRLSAIGAEEWRQITKPEGLRERTGVELARAYYSADELAAKRVRALFEEKYFSQLRLDLDPLGPADVEYLIRHFGSIRAETEGLTDEQRSEIAGAAREEMERLRQRDASFMTIRQVEAAILEKLCALRRIWERQPPRERQATPLATVAKYAIGLALGDQNASPEDFTGGGQ